MNSFFPLPPQTPTDSPTFWEQFFAFLQADSLAELLSWEFWFMLTIVLLAGEILTAGFLLGALTPGTLLACLAAALGLNMQLQLLAFVLGTLGGLIYLRPIFLRKMMTGGSPTNVDALVGSKAEVVEAICGTQPGRVKVMSEEWRARAESDFPQGAFVQVLAVEGNTLIVGPAA